MACKWRAGYGGLKLDPVGCLKLLEQENGCLRRAVSELTREELILKAPAEPWPEAASVGWKPRTVLPRRWIVERTIA